MGSLAIRGQRTVVALMGVSVIAVAVWAQEATSLIVTGQTGEAKVIQVDGRNYVDLDGIARVTNGTIRFNGAQVVLTLPGAGAAASPSTNPTSAAFSKAFLRTGIEAMSQIREWRIALKTAIDRSYPLSEDWIGAYRRQAEESLRLAGVAESTDADKNTYPLLTNEFNNMNNLSQKYLQMAKSETYITPNSLEDDPLNQHILNCAHSLSAMVGSNQFVDDGSCH